MQGNSLYTSARFSKLLNPILLAFFDPIYCNSNFTEIGHEHGLHLLDTLIVVSDRVLDKPRTHGDTGDDSISRIQ